jgi:hypothetical protein
LIVACTVETDRPECTTDGQCDDALYCNGREVCTGGRCGAGTAPCAEDGVACTTESCDELAQRCVHVPSHDACDDGDACNGLERCDEVLGCVTNARPECDDADACTVDSCDPSAGCVHTPQDRDGDGFGDIACGGLDCADDPDRGPAIHPGAGELCTDGIDNDCDGFADAASSTCPASADRCSTADLVADRSGTYWLSLRGLARDHDVGCAPIYVDAVMSLTLAAPRSVRIIARPLAMGGGGPGTGLALRRLDECELGPDVVAPRCSLDTAEGAVEIAAELDAGEYAVLIAGQPDATIALEIDLDATFAPVATCDAPIDVSTGGRFPIQVPELADLHVLPCGGRESQRDATFAFSLDAPRDLVATLDPPGKLAILRDCGGLEGAIACEATAEGTLRRSSLPAGDYFLVAEPPLFDAEFRRLVHADLDVAFAAPRSEGCAAPASIAIGAPTTVTLSPERSVGSACVVPAERDTARVFTLAETSDVTLTVSGTGDVLAAIASECGAIDTESVCLHGFGELSVTERGLPAGSYYAIAGGDTDTVTMTVERATAVPLAPGDRCLDAPALAIPSDERIELSSATSEGGVRCVTFAIGTPEVFRAVAITTAGRYRFTATTDRRNVGLELRRTCERAVVDSACNFTAPTTTLEHWLDPGTYVLVIETTDPSAIVDLRAEAL